MNRRAPRRRDRAQRGIVLLEVMVSILIFSIGLLGLLGLQARAISFSTDAEDRNRAALLANEISTTMWVTRSVAVVTSAGNPSWDARVADMTKGGLPNGLVTVTPVTATSADIVISWLPYSRASTDSRSQLRTRVVLPL